MKNENQKLQVNTKCIICGNEFEEPRKGKLYCSDLCRSRSYIENKKQKKKKENEIESKRFEFYHSEYEDIIKRLGMNDADMTFEMYCYYRYNIKKEATIDDIHKILISVNVNDLGRGGIASEAYSKFLNIFHNSGYLEVNP